MAEAQDLALLRRFEPILKFTAGERFFPVDVEPYVRASSLWIQHADGSVDCLIPELELTLDRLAEPRHAGPGCRHFLKFIEPLNLTQLASYRIRTIREGLTIRGLEQRFRTGRSRLARVGYLSRFVDSLFSLALLVRGRVPGDTAAAAVLEYERILRDQERYQYCGRVFREGPWTVLQYWFFYAFNNWRSGFFGVNDHEADWEMIAVYLSQAADHDLVPEWVAFACHDHAGDNLRRQWDDPELQKVGEHPLVHVAAGSHASYYAPGEYVAEIELPALTPLIRVSDRLRSSWSTLANARQTGEDSTSWRTHPAVFRIPFVDYARGDGLSVGPNQEKEWAAPRLLVPVRPWVRDYRGLWGLNARDPLAGENAPAGPMYSQDGTIRRSWYDPLGWCGLDKTPPATRAHSLLAKQQESLASQTARLAGTICVKQKELVGLGLEAAAMRGYPHLQRRYTAHQARISALEEELAGLRNQLAEDEALVQAAADYANALQSGSVSAQRSHLSRPWVPVRDEGRISRFAEVWAALSIGLMMIGFVLLLLLYRSHLSTGLVALISVIVFVEASLRGQLSRLIASVTVGLALFAALVLMLEYFWYLVALVVLVAGVYIVWENLREF
jgi:hypothetical protein